MGADIDTFILINTHIDPKSKSPLTMYSIGNRFYLLGGLL